MDKLMNWGIIGCGKMASKFAQDLALVNGQILYGVASRSISKAEAFKINNGATKSYGDYEAICQDPKIDIIYIATPHDSHLSNGIMAMNYGKHLLCEKPLAVNQTQVQKLIEIANSNQVFMMEAMWSRFNPCLNEVFTKIKQGDLGLVSYINADFCFPKIYQKEHRLFNPDLAGGALLDVGIYPIFLTYLMLGKPDHILSKSILKNGVDIQSSVILSYQQAQSIMSFGFLSQANMEARINTSKASILIHNRWHEADSYSILKKGAQTEQFTVPKQGYGYCHEIIECAMCIENGWLESKKWSHQNSLDMIKLMDEIRAQNKLLFPFES